jgi:hypothetical protein
MLEEVGQRVAPGRLEVDDADGTAGRVLMVARVWEAQASGGLGGLEVAAHGSGQAPKRTGHVGPRRGRLDGQRLGDEPVDMEAAPRPHDDARSRYGSQASPGLVVVDVIQIHKERAESGQVLGASGIGLTARGHADVDVLVRMRPSEGVERGGCVRAREHLPPTGQREPLDVARRGLCALTGACSCPGSAGWESRVLTHRLRSN